MRSFFELFAGLQDPSSHVPSMMSISVQEFQKSPAFDRAAIHSSRAIKKPGFCMLQLKQCS